MAHKLPELGYSYDALEPFIDAETMEIHYSKHHQAYTNNLNAALEKHEELQAKTPEDLLKDLNAVSEEIRDAVRNNGGGYVNHALFWKILKKDVKPEGEVIEAINKEFGSLDEFKTQFKQAAVTQFGSGWAWLVVNGGKLEIMKTGNQDNPISEGKIPILMIDVWEHAYYLKYQNKRPDYVDAFFNVINWEQVNKNFSEATG